MAGKCGCAGTTCSCKVIGEGAVTVSGAGSSGNPYRISVALALHAFDSPTIDISLLGDGSASNPYSLSAEATLRFGDLLDVDTSVTTTGYVPARQGDGTFALVPPSTAAAGTISVGPSIEGDGSSGDVLDVRLRSNSGLLIDSGGLGLDPYTVTTESELDTLYGSTEPGTVVSMTDGSAAWVKSTSGWVQFIEDTGIISTVSGNITASSGWSISAVSLSRRNGLVSGRIVFTTLVSRVTAIGNGNIGNIQVGNIVQSQFRPIMETPLRVLGAGDDSGFYLTPSGNFYVNNLSTADYTLPAGYTWSIGGTWIGA